MKKLNQKQWGILGTSLGSVLIIVALLTMVGIGSGDTYAATNFCGCTKGRREGNKCVETKTESVTCQEGTKATGTLCSSLSGYTCTAGGACTDAKGNPILNCSKKNCTKTTTNEYSCTCTSGTPNSTGACITSSTPTSCSSGEYISGSTCELCQSGSYCPGDGKIYTCPTNATCSASSFTCNKGYHKSGNICAADTGTNIGNCPAGTYYQGQNHAATCTEGYYCPGGTYNANTGDIIQGCERIACPTNATCTTSSFTCNSGYEKNTSGTACVEKPNIGNCPAGTYYQGLNHAATCPSGYYCPGGTYNANTGDIISGCEKIACPTNATCTTSSFTCNTGYHVDSTGTTCVANGNGNPNPGTDGNGNKPNPGTDGNGGNDGTGGNGGNGSGNNGNNTNTNPSTATKTPLVIVIIGIVAMGLGTFTYYKSKNNEI